MENDAITVRFRHRSSLVFAVFLVAATNKSRAEELCAPACPPDQICESVPCKPAAEKTPFRPLSLLRSSAQTPGDGPAPQPSAQPATAKQVSHKGFFPFFVSKKDAQGSATAIGPVFGWKSATGGGGGLFPILSFGKDATHRHYAVMPLFGYFADGKRATSTLLVGPFLRHVSKTGSISVGFPLFWRVVNGAERDTVFFPFYWQSSSPDRLTRALFPLFLDRRTADARTTLIGPFWRRHKRDGSSAIGLFPLFAYANKTSPEHPTQPSRWLWTPLSYWRKDAAAAREDLWALLFFRRVRDQNRTSGLIPLGFSWQRGSSHKFIAPFVFHSSDDNEKSAFTAAGPLYFGHDHSGNRFGFFPLIFSRHFSDGKRNTLLPFVYLQNRPDGSFLFTPLFGWSTAPSSRRIEVGPVYYRHDPNVRSFALWPLVYWGRDRAAPSKTHIVLPLYFDRQSEPGHRLSFYTPLLWHAQSIERSTWVAPPLYFDSKSYGESRVSGFLPLFVRKNSQATQSTNWVFPPLLSWLRFRHGEDKGTDFVFFPLVWRYSGTKPSTVVAPVYFDFVRGESRTTVFAPFGAHWRRHDAEHTLVLNTYYRKGRGPLNQGSWYLNVFPLVTVAKPHPGDIKWDVLEGLFGYSRLGRNRTFTLLWLLDFRLAPAAQTSLTWWSSTPPSQRTEF